MQQPASLPADTQTAASSLREADEPLTLSGAFPDAPHNLDELFPEPHMRQLLAEIAGDLRGVEKFVGRITRELNEEVSGEDA